MKKFFRFFISKQFLINLGGIILAWILLIWIVFASIKDHTNWDQEIKVPSFYKIHMDDLDEFVKTSNVNYVIQDSVYLDDWPKGTVCWQYPEPTDSSGMMVKEGRTIVLSVVPLHPKMIAMPQVKEMSKRMAETTLSSLGIKTKISYRQAVEGPGYVIDQYYNGKPIKTGTMIPKGSRVELIVSQGRTGEASALPNLVGLTIRQAEERLLTLTLAMYVEYDESVITEEDRLNAVITNQNPAGGESISVAAGTTVTIWATKNTGGGN
ncbi:PASTA domain-containing protein [Crocinitomix catalasitica]|nr:PASTA domain-containing protein [Crocinitomix catalasitica]